MNNGDLLSDLWSATEAPRLSPRAWELVLGQARASRLMGRLALLIATRGWASQLPPAALHHLDSGQRFADRLRHDVQAELGYIEATLGHLPTPVVLLKGAAYVAADLPPARGRLFSDVDIMVRRDQLEAVELALFAAGWIPEKLTPYDDRYYRQWMHELPPLQHVHRRAYLDVHHTIAPPTSRFAIDGERLLAACQPVPGAARLAMLAPADMVLHSAVHLFQEGEFNAGLRDLLDLNDLLLHFGAEPAFWPGLLARAEALGAGVPLGYALIHVRRLFGTRAPAALQARVDALTPRRLQRHLMTALLRRALRPDHPSCDVTGTKLARWLLYLRSHWLRMPWYQIVPHLLRKAWMRAAARREGKPPPPQTVAGPATAATRPVPPPDAAPAPAPRPDRR